MECTQHSEIAFFEDDDVANSCSNAPKTPWFRWLENGFGPDQPENALRHPEPAPAPGSPRTLTNREEFSAELERDKVAARRSLRTASWGMMFYLVRNHVRNWLTKDHHRCDWSLQCTVCIFDRRICWGHHAV